MTLNRLVEFDPDDEALAEYYQIVDGELVKVKEPGSGAKDSN